MNLNQARTLGIAIALIGLAAVGLLAHSGRLPGSTPLAFLTVVLAGAVGGRWIGLVAAALVGAYSTWAFGPPDPIRQIVLAVSALAAGWTAGYLRYRYRLLAEEAGQIRWKAQLVDEINGNLEKLAETHKLASDLWQGWPVLSDEAKSKKVDEIRGKLAGLRQLVEGWHAIAQERERTKRALASQADQ